MSLERTERLRERLQEQLQPSALEIIDESAKHAGHTGADDCQFTVDSFNVCHLISF